MWTCPRCGEPNEDSFKDCWKCLSDELTQQITATPPPPAPPPPILRSPASVLLRGAVGFGVGLLLGVIVFHRQGISLEQASVAGFVVGAAFAVVVGIWFWVLFPFEYGAVEPPPEQTDHGGETNG